MSKSLGNFYTLRDLFSKGFTGREIRYLLLSAHYRESLNFTIDGLNAARSALARLDECLGKLKEIANNINPTENNSQFIQQFDEALSNNINLSQAWSVVFDWVRDLNRLIAENKLSPQDAANALSAWERVNHVLGIKEKSTVSTENIPTEIADLLAARQNARKAKNFAEADLLRDTLKQKGWLIEDTPKGPRLKKI